MKYRVRPNDAYGERVVDLYSTEAPNEIAHMAFNLLHKWGPVCATTDGEDSTGRAKIRDLTPAETVARAFDIAEEAYRVARERRMLIDVPDLDEINREHAAERAKRKEAHT